MIRALFKPASMAALLAAASLAIGVSSASAADLGGDCCADLEERVAELEATTARKGNRKVSLEISGQVNEAVMFWDDGDEFNTYVVTNDQARTRFRFKGEAKVTDDVKAGYRIEVGVRTANSARVTQLEDDIGAGFDLRYSHWFVSSKTYGEITLGQTEMASQGITEINLSATKDFAKLGDVEDTGLGLFLRREGVAGDAGLSGIQWFRLISPGGDQPGEGDRQNVVRYDTPTLMGFKATTAWGEDDFWDVGLRYSGEFNSIKVSAGVAYGEITDGVTSGNTIGVTCPISNATLSGGDTDCNQVGGSISVMHAPSGVYVNFAAGRLVDDRIDDTVTAGVSFEGTGADDESDFFHVQAGVEQKWNPLGKTTIWGEYYEANGGANARNTLDGSDAGGAFGLDGDPLNRFSADSRIFSTNLEMFGFGVAQGIDAAAMHAYLFYRHYEGDLIIMEGLTGVGATAETDVEDLDVVMGGAIIRF